MDASPVGELALGPFALASFAVAMVPGASWIFVMTATVQAGSAGSLAAIAGNGVGILIHGVAAAVLFGTLGQVGPDWLGTLGIAGGAYLVWLAVQIVRQPPTRPESLSNAKQIRSTLIRGIWVNLSNPKVMLLMLALFPQTVSSASGTMGIQALTAGLVHLLIATAVLTVVAAGTLRIRAQVLSAPGWERGLRWLSAMVLLGLAVRFLGGQMGSYWTS